MAENKSNAPEVEDVFDDAEEEFPGKEDLKDRLVAIWPTGVHGIRKGTDVGARPYPWYETITLVLDDGPNWNGTKIVDGESKPMLVASVAEDGPQKLDFQHTTSGLTARLSQRVNLSAETPAVNGAPITDRPKTFRPMLGRINSQKNRTQGRSPSWSIAKPTEEDKIIARKYNDLMAQISADVQAAVENRDKKSAEADEFDE